MVKCLWGGRKWYRGVKEMERNSWMFVKENLDRKIIIIIIIIIKIMIMIKIIIIIRRRRIVIIIIITIFID